VNSASKWIEKHCSLPREQIIVGKLLWDDFFDFLKIFPKIMEQIPCREAASNALIIYINYICVITSSSKEPI
jgi:hypothetical protein